MCVDGRIQGWAWPKWVQLRAQSGVTFPWYVLSGELRSWIGVPGKTMRTQFRAGKVGLSDIYIQWVKVGGGRAEGDRITPRLLPRASG